MMSPEITNPDAGDKHDAFVLAVQNAVLHATVYPDSTIPGRVVVSFDGRYAQRNYDLAALFIYAPRFQVIGYFTLTDSSNIGYLKSIAIQMV